MELLLAVLLLLVHPGMTAEQKTNSKNQKSDHGRYPLSDGGKSSN